MSRFEKRKIVSVNLTDKTNNLNIKRIRPGKSHRNLKEVRVVEGVRYLKRLKLIILANVAVWMPSMKED